MFTYIDYRGRREVYWHGMPVGYAKRHNESVGPDSWRYYYQKSIGLVVEHCDDWPALVKFVTDAHRC